MNNSTGQPTPSGEVQTLRANETAEIRTLQTTTTTVTTMADPVSEQPVSTTQEAVLHTEELLNPVHIDEQATLQLQTKAQSMFEKLDARYALPVEQPVHEPDGIKARRERNARIARAKELTPSGDEYTTIFMDASKRRERTLDMSTPDTEMQPYMDRAVANGIDARQLRTFCRKVTLDKMGAADPAQQERIKRDNMRFIDDFSSGDQQRQIPHLDRITEEMLLFKFSPSMFEPVRMAQNMPQLLEIAQYLTSLQDLRRQFPWYFDAQPAFRKAMLDNLSDLSAVFGTHLQNVMAAHAFDYAHDGVLQSAAPMVEMQQMSAELFTQALTDYTQKRETAMRAEADRLALLPVEENITIINVQQIGQGAYKYGLPSGPQAQEILKKQSNLSDREFAQMMATGKLDGVLRYAVSFNALLSGIGSGSDTPVFTALLAEHKGFIESAAALSAQLKSSDSSVERDIAGTLGFMAMKAMSYSAVLVNLEAEYKYSVSMGDVRTLKTQMTDSALGEEFEGRHQREQYKENLQNPDGVSLPVLSKSLRRQVGRKIADDKDFSAIVMTVEAYEDFLGSAQVPPCETPEEKEKYPERIEKLLGELLAFNDRITARSLGYLDYNAEEREKKVFCEALEKHVLGRDTKDNNFERVAELAYRLRHNDFSNAAFNSAYTGKTITEALRNTRIAEVDVKSKDYIKAGDAASVVYISKKTLAEQAVYRRGAEYRPWKEVLSGDRHMGVDLDEVKGAISGYETTGGRIIDAHKSSRDVAVSRVDKLLGSGVIAEASQVRFTVDGKKQTIGTKMEKGGGKEAGKYRNEKDKKTGLTTARHVDFFGGAAPDGPENTTVNLSAPESLEKIYWLQVVDAICGSADRHTGNFFLQTDRRGTITGITGIDNDMAFGEAFLPLRNEHDQVDMCRKNRNLFYLFTPVYDSAFPCIPLSIYKKVMALTPEALSNELRGSIRDGELQTTVLRLKALQEHFSHIPRFNLSKPSQAQRCAEITKRKVDQLRAEATVNKSILPLTRNYFAMVSM